MKNSKNILFTIFIFSGLFLASFISAATPTLSISSTGTGDSVQINVTGDPNSSILFFSSNNNFSTLGTTNSNGTFSTIINSSTYGIATNAPVYVRTGGISGAQSNVVSWPYIQPSSTATGSLTLSQSAILLNVGQTSVITASANYLYLSSNSSPAIANINLNANQITVSANAYGSSTAKICVLGSTTNCVNLVITVQNSGDQQLAFNQNNFSIYSGQTATVTITGGSGNYIISNNSNLNSVQASLNGSVVTLSATGTNGVASITICTQDMARCGILNVNSTNVNSTAITFSQTNPFVSLNQNTTVTIYGGTGTNFYVSSNSSPSTVQANITGNILTLIGNTTGTSAISICAFAGSCATITANVGVSTGNNSTLMLSQNTISIIAGQTTTITISGGSTPYSVSSSNSANIFNSSVNGNILTIYGVNPGSATANVCSSVGCVTLSVTVNNSASTVNPPSFSQNNILLNVGQQTIVYISGTGNYYVANNTSPNTTMVSINGNSATVQGLVAGSNNISFCQNNGQCSTLYVTVSAPVINNVVPIVPPPVENYFTLNRYLGPGDKGDDVLQLQKALVKLELLSAVPNGYYGAATTSAVKIYQNLHNIRQTGNIGPATKISLENLKIKLSENVSSSSQQKIADLQAAINLLKMQINASKN